MTSTTTTPMATTTTTMWIPQGGTLAKAQEGIQHLAEEIVASWKQEALCQSKEEKEEKEQEDPHDHHSLMVVLIDHSLFVFRGVLAL
jgi:trehalose-6-phosphate synthase